MSASSIGKFFFGALIGGAIGAALGMLLAPRSGAETREMIRDEFDSRKRACADSLREKSDVLKEKATAFRDQMSDLSHNLEETGRKTVSKFTERKQPSESPN